MLGLDFGVDVLLALISAGVTACQLGNRWHKFPNSRKTFQQRALRFRRSHSL